MGMLFFTLQPDQRLALTGANPAADTILGVDHGTLIDRSIGEIVPALAGTDLPELFSRIARDGGIFQTDLEIPKNNNRG